MLCPFAAPAAARLCGCLSMLAANHVRVRWLQWLVPAVSAPTTGRTAALCTLSIDNEWHWSRGIAAEWVVEGRVESCTSATL
jgi:hypothetical protein